MCRLQSTCRYRTTARRSWKNRTPTDWWTRKLRNEAKKRLVFNDHFLTGSAQDIVPAHFGRDTRSEVQAGKRFCSGASVCERATDSTPPRHFIGGVLSADLCECLFTPRRNLKKRAVRKPQEAAPGAPSGGLPLRLGESANAVTGVRQGCDTPCLAIR
jgi:hypothetical protein